MTDPNVVTGREAVPDDLFDDYMFMGAQALVSWLASNPDWDPNWESDIKELMKLLTVTHQDVGLFGDPQTTKAWVACLRAAWDEHNAPWEEPDHYYEREFDLGALDGETVTLHDVTVIAHSLPHGELDVRIEDDSSIMVRRTREGEGS